MDPSVPMGPGSPWFNDLIRDVYESRIREMSELKETAVFYQNQSQARQAHITHLSKICQSFEASREADKKIIAMLKGKIYASRETVGDQACRISSLNEQVAYYKGAYNELQKQLASINAVNEVDRMNDTLTDDSSSVLDEETESLCQEIESMETPLEHEITGNTFLTNFEAAWKNLPKRSSDSAPVLQGCMKKVRNEEKDGNQKINMGSSENHAGALESENQSFSRLTSSFLLNCKSVYAGAKNAPSEGPSMLQQLNMSKQFYEILEYAGDNTETDDSSTHSIDVVE